MTTLAQFNKQEMMVSFERWEQPHGEALQQIRVGQCSNLGSLDASRRSSSLESCYAYHVKHIVQYSSDHLDENEAGSQPSTVVQAKCMYATPHSSALRSYHPRDAIQHA
jgi:hypothetical protein